MEKAWHTFRARRHFVIKPKKLTLSPNPNLNPNPSPNPKPNLNPINCNIQSKNFRKRVTSPESLFI